MKEQIRDNLGNPKELERVYRSNKAMFKREFNLLYPEIQDHTTAQIWHERLNYEKDQITWGTSRELIFIIVAVLLAGFLVKIPHFTNVDWDFYYSRNLSFFVLPFLMAYFAWKQHMDIKKLLPVIAAISVSIVVINSLPGPPSDTLDLSTIHLPLFLWVVLGYTFVAGDTKNLQKRLDFLKFNGELVLMTTIILLAGLLLVLISWGLFSLIDVEIEDFILDYVVIWGLPASPIVAAFLVQSNPRLLNKVSPVIAKMFTPVVLVTLIAFLVAFVVTMQNPFSDRDVLVVFNLLLVCVMAIVLFSVAEKSKHPYGKIGTYLLLALTLATVIVNIIALSAIVYRLSEWGITPNRLAVLGSNLLMLANLLWLNYKLFKTIYNSNEFDRMGDSIAVFLPIYGLWAGIVTFLFPFIFSFQ